jgi:hypothetical protein
MASGRLLNDRMQVVQMMDQFDKISDHQIRLDRAIDVVFTRYIPRCRLVAQQQQISQGERTRLSQARTQVRDLV